MLLVLTSVLGYELKTAVGTSVFIMTFTALTGAISHFVIGGLPDATTLIRYVTVTLLWARVAARSANKGIPSHLEPRDGGDTCCTGYRNPHGKLLLARHSKIPHACQSNGKHGGFCISRNS